MLAPDQQERLEHFVRLLRIHAPRAGLLSPGDIERVWDRHILDSLRAVPCLPRPSARVVDVGSGAGLPGVPLAVAAPELAFSLVEPKSRRVAFLELAVRELRLQNVDVVARRIEEVAIAADAVVARAFAGGADVWRRCSGLLKPDGRIVYFAGRSWGHVEESEVREAGATPAVCVVPDFEWQGPVVIMRPAAEALGADTA